MDLFNDNIKTGILNTVPNDYIILYLIDNNEHNVLKNYIITNDNYIIKMNDTYKKIFEYDYDLYCIFIKKIFQYKTPDNSKYIHDYMIMDIRYLTPIDDCLVNYNNMGRLKNSIDKILQYEITLTDQEKSAIIYIIKRCINYFSDYYNLHTILRELYYNNILLSCIKSYNGRSIRLIHNIVYSMNYIVYNNTNESIKRRHTQIIIECLKMAIKYNQFINLNNRDYSIDIKYLSSLGLVIPRFNL